MGLDLGSASCSPRLDWHRTLRAPLSLCQPRGSHLCPSSSSGLLLSRVPPSTARGAGWPLGSTVRAKRDGMIHSMVMGQVGNGVSAVPVWLPSLPPCPARDRMQSLLCRDARAGFPGTGACSWHYRASPHMVSIPSMLTDDDPLEVFSTFHGRQQLAQTPQSKVFINLLPVQSSLPFSPLCMSCTPAQSFPSSAKADSSEMFHSGSANTHKRLRATHFPLGD